MLTEVKRIVSSYYWQGTYVQNEGQTSYAFLYAL